MLKQDRYQQYKRVQQDISMLGELVDYTRTEIREIVHPPEGISIERYVAMIWCVLDGNIKPCEDIQETINNSQELAAFQKDWNISHPPID